MSDAGSVSSLTDYNDQLVLKHGLLPYQTHKMNSKVHTVLYKHLDGTCVVLLTGGIAVFQYGRQIMSIEGDHTDYTILLYAKIYDKYIGITKHKIDILHSNFTVLFTTNSITPITCCIYNQYNGDIITGGFGNINIWKFHQGGKTLVLSQVIGTELKDEDITILHLEEVPGNAQRIFAVVRNGVKVFHLASTRLLNEGKCLHCRPISAILFFRPLKLLITGARDGAIKIWNSTWDLQYTFISHQSPVTGLSPYPNGPYIISSSLDGTLRIWDLTYWDEIQKLDHNVPVRGLYGLPGHNTVVSYSSRQLRLWSVSELYHRTSVIGAECSYLTSTTHPRIPLRLVAICNDSTIRIISPVNGTILTTALLPTSSTITSVAYMPSYEWLFILTSNGIITKFNSQTNPCQQISQWIPQEHLGNYSCLCLYELIMDEEEIDDLLTHDKWLLVVVEAQKRKRGIEDPLKREIHGQHLIISGTEKGYLCVFNKENGDIQCTVKGHDNPVSIITSNYKRDQLLTSSTDHHIVVWRVYSYTKECLVLMMSFDVIGIPAHIAVLSDRICVCINDNERANYTITLYSMRDKMTYSSNPVYNHSEMITGLHVSTNLHMFVSCSTDYTVRVWSEDNNILRILELDAPPTAIVFSSPFSAITVCLRKHLYTIPHSTHLTENYIKQLVSLGLREEEEKEREGEQEREMCQDFECYSSEDQVRLKPIDDEFKVESYRGALSEEELDALDRLSDRKKKAIELLLLREQELKDIRDGIITTRKEPKGLTGLQRNQAWKEVFALFHPLPSLNIHISNEDEFDPDNYGMMKSIPEPYEPYCPGIRRGFFPPLSKFDPPYPIAPDGYLPNSSILQQLRKSEEDRLLAESWSPPTLSDKQRQLMEETREIEEENDDEYDNEESELMTRLKAAMITSTDDSPELILSPSPSPPPEPKRELKSQMKVEKLIAPKAKPKSPPPPPRTPTPPPPPPRSPTPPPPTPLPEYISQFIGQSWFDSLFPNASSKTIPRPWTVTRFIYNLLSHLKSRIDIYIKADICMALLKLIKQHDPSNRTDIHTTVIQLLTGTNMPSSQHIYERHLVHKSLQLLLYIDELDSKVTSILMGYYSEGNNEIQDMILDYLESKGVNDPYKYFPREMDTQLTGSGMQLSDMVTKSTVWLDTWAEDYLKTKGVRLLKTPATSTKGQSLRSIKSQPILKGRAKNLLVYNPVEVINHFVKMEHERAMARRRTPTPPPPPPEPVEDVPHNVVVPLPHLDHTRGCLVRLGETHCSKCHPERETGLAHLTHILSQRQNGEPLNAIHLALKTQYINPFLTKEERQEIEFLTHSRKHLMSQTRLFLLEQSYPQ